MRRRIVDGESETKRNDERVYGMLLFEAKGDRKPRRFLVYPTSERASISAKSPKQPSKAIDENGILTSQATPSPPLLHLNSQAQAPAS